MRLDLTGDRRGAENVILEVTKAARRFGLEIEKVVVISQPATSRKTKKPASRRKPRARA